jgi:hypothetical protein
MLEYRKGHVSDIFRQNKASNTHPAHLSFSIYYSDDISGASSLNASLSPGGGIAGDHASSSNSPVRTLDIVCKDYDEFVTWSSGLLWLIANKETVRAEALTFTRPSDAAIQTTKLAAVVDVHQLRGRMQSHFDLCTWGSSAWGQLGHTDRVDDLADVDLPKVLPRPPATYPVPSRPSRLVCPFTVYCCSVSKLCYAVCLLLVRYDAM